MNKLYIFIFIAILIGAGFFAYFKISEQNGVQGEVSPQKSDLTQATVEFSVKNDGTKIEPPLILPNVFLESGAVEAPVSVTTDSVTGSTTATLVETDAYSLYAFSGTDGDSFMINLHADNLRQARIDGEKELLRRLNITEEQACKLSISVTVSSPYNVSLDASEFGLSFCPNRVDLPTELMTVEDNTETPSSL